MKTFTDTAAILDNVKNLHRRLLARYRRGGEEVKLERAKMIFETAARQQEQVLESIARFERQASSDLLDAHFQYTPEDLEEASFSPGSVAAEMTVDDVVRLVVRNLSVLLEIYRRLTEMSAYEEVSELFGSLEQQLQSMRDRLAQSSQQLKDI